MSDDIRINNDNSVLTVRFVQRFVGRMKHGRESKRGCRKEEDQRERERIREKKKRKLSGGKRTKRIPSVILNAVASSRERERRDGKSSASRLPIADRIRADPIKEKKKQKRVSAFNERLRGLRLLTCATLHNAARLGDAGIFGETFFCTKRKKKKKNICERSDVSEISSSTLSAAGRGVTPSLLGRTRVDATRVSPRGVVASTCVSPRTLHE